MAERLTWRDLDRFREPEPMTARELYILLLLYRLAMVMELMLLAWRIYLDCQK